MEETQAIEINGMEYFLVDSISNNGKMYYYFSNEKDPNDIYVLTDSVDNGEEYLVSVDNGDEFDDALILFFEKHKDDSKNY